jgi:hypothetical protein
MPIVLTPFAIGSLCQGNTWAIPNAVELADQIARVAMGQSRHVEKILAGTSLKFPASSPGAKKAAIKLLTAADDPWHRDGWMFQVMSWIAAHTSDPSGIIRPPHMIPAHKGFDGLQLEVDSATGTVTAVVIFEDKATDRPRETIRNEVWETFKKLEEGEEDNLLTAEVGALLQTQPQLDPAIAIENIIWKQARHYRVCITVGRTHSTEAGRSSLFQGYDLVAAGQVERRRGETFHVENLRGWMQELADSAIASIFALSP